MMKHAPTIEDRPVPGNSPEAPADESVSPLSLFPVIVGIGCSAGGLSALKAFVANIASDSKEAYVVVQHLAPDHPSALVELLQSASRLPVVLISDGQAIGPGSVYVAPEASELSLQADSFKLTEQVRSAGARLPIDPFFRSLAESRREQAIGVLLSGMGSDGIEGLRAIKAGGGFTLAQDPASAEAASMPRGAIAAGVVDVVAVAEALPGAIASGPPPQPKRLVRSDDQARDEIIDLLKLRSGHDFSLYKSSFLNRRFERRMAVHGMKVLDDYAFFLKLNPEELDLLFREVLIGVTQFFRDPKVWDELRDKVLPDLFQRHPGGGILRAWVPACSTGEEVYSLAIAFREALGIQKPKPWFALQIFATDICRESIEQARKGLFPEELANELDPERLARFFVHEERGGYRIVASIREMVTFATHNILIDPIISRIDILCCRNLLIYFGDELKDQTLRLLCHALNPGGFLLLGSAESIGKFGDLLVPVNRKNRLFQRIEAPMKWTGSLVRRGATLPQEPPAVSQQYRSEGPIDHIANEVVWGILGPAALAVNAEGDILHVRGRIEKYLEPSAGKTNLNIYALAKGDLAKILATAIPEAVKTSRPIFYKSVALSGNHQGSRISVLVRSVDGSGGQPGLLVVCFVDAMDQCPPPALSPELPSDSRNLQVDLQLARDALLLARKESRSAEEELRSSNEELRAVNEELATSREELQSLNEEQLTINVELQAKVEELTGARDDLANLLNSIGIATIFLDHDMRLRRFNNAANSIFKLLPNDIGRPLGHIVSSLDYPEFAQDSEKAMRSNSCIEKVVKTWENTWHRVRITPYHHRDSMDGSGVVVSFIDITEFKKLEQQLRNRSEERKIPQATGAPALESDGGAG